jgi:hypothetical protein
LRDQCFLFAADPTNPWALAHGITAFGSTFVAKDGRKASDVIIHDFLLRSAPDAGPSATYSFLRFAPDGTPIEPHTNLNTKALVLSGLPLSTRFKTSFGTVTLKQLVDSVKASFRHVPQSDDYWRDAAWTLDLLSHQLTPKNARFTTSDGQTVDFNKVMDDAFTYLEKADGDLQFGMEHGLPEVAKRKQGIYAHNCGGIHLVEAVLTWARFPEVKKAWGKRFDTQVKVLFYRVDSEYRQYQAALSQAPQYRLQLLTQEVKFYGHFLEAAGRLKEEVGFKPDTLQLQTIAKAKAYLDHAVRGLEELKAFDRMDELKKTQHQVYLDLIGDSCHASNGWDKWPTN